MLNQEKYCLVIDDDVELTQQISALLSENGFIPVVANRVTEATTKLGNQRFYCIILDLRLESNSGIKIVRYVRNPKAEGTFNFETPILILSGYLDAESIKLLKDDVQGILAKPLQGAMLIEKVRLIGSGQIQPKNKAAPKSPGQRRWKKRFMTLLARWPNFCLRWKR